MSRSDDGTWLALGAVTLAGVVGAVRRGSLSDVRDPRDVVWDPREGVIYGQIYFDQDNYHDNLGDIGTELMDDEREKHIRYLAAMDKPIEQRDRWSVTRLVQAEWDALKQLARITGLRFDNEGHDAHDALVIKTWVPDVAAIRRLHDQLEGYNYQRATDRRRRARPDEYRGGYLHQEYLAADIAPYFLAQNWLVYPQGVNGPSYPLEEWVKRVRPVLGGHRLVSLQDD